ncbi:ADP-ribosyltransferase [Lactiplantibacillus plantarum]|uniref:ADP-ribosyltransferase n=1 Tax=Lactiplantibacillus plantarum TaxID=1590 RepID=UPI001BA7F279|nr:ADP-ribosyltransferase [Lactiplantibacillus plantarum]MBS0956383.1 hypothetical protein [Lactiplantibacillus plantarum]
MNLIKKITILFLFSSCSFLLTTVAIDNLPVMNNSQPKVVFAADEDEDFGDNDEKATEWADRETENWQRTPTEKDALQDYVSNKNDLATNMESYTLTPIEMFEDKSPEAAEKYRQLENAFKKAKLSSGLYCYKDFKASDIGLVGNLDNENFQSQFGGKNIKLTNYYDANLTNNDINKDSNLIFRLKIPSNRGGGFTPQAGLERDQNGRFHVLVNNNYNIHIDNSRTEIIKGRRVIFANCTLADNLDFKNDLKSAEKWGLDNYQGNVNSADPYKEWAPIIKPGGKYNETQLNAEEEKSLNDYLNNGYKTINGYLRDGNHTENESLNQTIDNLSKGLATRPIPDNITLYRWMGFKDLGYSSMPSVNELKNDLLADNKVITDPGFLSTSAFSGSANFSSARSIVLRINVPRGTKGGFPYGGDNSALSINGGEGEVLLDKGQKYQAYRITESVVRGKKKIVIDANLVN